MTEDKTKESPDTDKALELTDDKPPDMGKGEELVEGKPGEETTAPDIEKAEEEKLSPELEAVMKKKGFKDLSEVAKALDSSDRKITELESDARLRSFIPSEVPERPRGELAFKPMPTLTKDPYDMSKEEFNEYQKQKDEVLEHNVTIKYLEAKKDEAWDKEYRETMAVVNKDPQRFEVLKPTLATLHRKYPDASLAQIMPMADEMEKTQGQRNKDAFIKEVFGPNADVDKLKTIISKARPAVISDAGGAGAKGGEKTGRQKAEDTIWDGIKKSDVRRE